MSKYSSKIAESRAPSPISNRFNVRAYIHKIAALA
ncbi:unnamed protein product, partial [Rotaria socialis]